MYLRDKWSGLCNGTHCRVHTERYAVIIGAHQPLHPLPTPTPLARYHYSFIPYVSPHLSLKHTCVQGPRRWRRDSPLNVRNICKYSQEKRAGEEKVEKAWGRGSEGDVIPLHPTPHPVRERTTAVMCRAGQRKDGGWDKRERRGDGDAGVGWREGERQKMLQVAADGGSCEVAETTESTITWAFFFFF